MSQVQRAEQVALAGAIIDAANGLEVAAQRPFIPADALGDFAGFGGKVHERLPFVPSDGADPGRFKSHESHGPAQAPYRTRPFAEGS